MRVRRLMTLAWRVVSAATPTDGDIERRLRRWAVIWTIGFLGTCVTLLGSGWAASLEPETRCSRPTAQPEGFTGSSGELAAWRGGVDCSYTNREGASREVHLSPTAGDVLGLAMVAGLMGLFAVIATNKISRTRLTASSGR